MVERSSSESGPTRRQVLPNKRDAIDRATRMLIEDIESSSYDPTSCFAVRLALEEALTNAYKHGNKEDPNKSVIVDSSIEPHRIVIEIQDEGSGFDPGTVPDPTAEENLEIPSGRGLVLMQSFMTTVEVVAPGNRIRMVYDKPQQ